MSWNPFRGREPATAIVAHEGSNGAAPISLSIERLPEIRVKHVVEHKQRPPAPRPERITVIYEMQDGREYREFIPLYGQSEFKTHWPHYLTSSFSGDRPPVSIRYHLGYADTGC